MPFIDVRKNQGSLVTTVPLEDTVPGDFSVLENFVFDRDGLPVVRGGRKSWNTSALTGTDRYVRGLFHFRQSWVAKKPREWLILFGNGIIRKSEMDGTLDPILASVGANSSLSFAVSAGNLFVASDSNNINVPHYWDGAMDSMERVKGTPPSVLVASHANRLWLVERGAPSTLRYSAPYDPLNWSNSQGSGYIVVEPGDGNEISALVPGFAGEMIVFKDGPSGGATYRLQGVTESTFSVVPLSSTLGAVSHATTSLVGDKDVMFCSRRGIHSLRRVFEHGDLESAYIDSEVSDRWRDVPLRRKKKAVAVDDYGHDLWWLSYDTDGDGLNDKTMVFNYRYQTPRGNPKVSELDYGFQSAAVFNDARNGRDELLTGGFRYAYLEHREEAQDTSGSARADYDWEAVLMGIDAGDAYTMKAWKEMWLSYDNWGEGDINIVWYGDSRYPNEDAITMNPADMPTPYYARKEIRLVPSSIRGRTVVHLREGGTTINVGMSGTRGRTRLRGFRFVFDVGKMDVTADRQFPYKEVRHG